MPNLLNELTFLELVCSWESPSPLSTGETGGLCLQTIHIASLPPNTAAKLEAQKSVGGARTKSCYHQENDKLAP